MVCAGVLCAQRALCLIVLCQPASIIVVSNRIDSMLDDMAKAYLARKPVASTAAGAKSNSSAAAAAAAATASEKSSEGDEFVWASVDKPSQESVFIGGRVCAEDEGSLSKAAGAGSMCLEGSRTTNGRRIKIDPSDLKSYSFFSGQIIGFRGVNPHGKVVTIEELLPPVPLPRYALNWSHVCEMNRGIISRAPPVTVTVPAPQSATAAAAAAATPTGTQPSQSQSQQTTITTTTAGRPLSIVCAAGPFTTTDNMFFSPLLDLLGEVNKLKPDVLVLMGPFVDSAHAQVKDPTKMTLTHGDLFLNLLSDVIKQLHFIRTKLVVIPSLRDVHHPDFVYPQSPFSITESDLKLPAPLAPGKLTFLSNPCTFRVNDTVIAVNNIDCIKHLGGDELAKGPSGAAGTAGSGGVNRIKRLASHIIEQRTFYPLQPAPAGSVSDPVNIDLFHAKKFALPCTPDVMITPSVLPPIVDDIGSGVLWMNMQSLAKANKGGTYGLLTIHPLSDAQINSKGADFDEPVTERFLPARIRMDVLAI